MYYMNLFTKYKPTPKNERINVRQTLNRDKVMSLKLRYQHNQCFFCGETIQMNAHLDHLIPVYYGGTNKLRNLVASCKSCNLTKRTDQIEILNKYTIRDYQKLIKIYNKVKDKPYRHRVKEYQLYKVYRADLFKETK